MPMWCDGGGAAPCGETAPCGGGWRPAPYNGGWCATAPYDDGGCAAAGCGIASCHGRRVRYPRHIGDMRHCHIAYRCDGSRSVLHCDGPCSVSDHRTVSGCRTAIDHHTVPDRHMVSDHRTVSDHHTALRLCGATCTACVQPLRGCMCPCHHHVVIPSAVSYSQ